MIDEIVALFKRLKRKIEIIKEDHNQPHNPFYGK